MGRVTRRVAGYIAVCGDGVTTVFDEFQIAKARLCDLEDMIENGELVPRESFYKEINTERDKNKFLTEDIKRLKRAHKSDLKRRVSLFAELLRAEFDEETFGTRDERELKESEFVALIDEKERFVNSDGSGKTSEEKV